MNLSQEFRDLVENARKGVREVSVDETVVRLERGAKLIDVREDREWSAGHAPAATHLSRGIIERDIVQTLPDKLAELILYCGRGNRSILAAESLQRMGYTNVFSMTDGWKGWVAAKMPVKAEND